MTEPSETESLRARVAELEGERDARDAIGRRPDPARTADGRLIARVCRIAKVSRKDLARRLGVTAGVLSRANASEPTPLAEKHREALRAMLKKDIDSAGTGR